MPNLNQSAFYSLAIQIDSTLIFKKGKEYTGLFVVCLFRQINKQGVSCLVLFGAWSLPFKVTSNTVHFNEVEMF